MPHYYTEADVSTERIPGPEWQLVFDGRACHGFNLGDEYRMQCASEVRSTLGGTLGKVHAYQRERNGRLKPCSDGMKATRACTAVW